MLQHQQRQRTYGDSGPKTKSKQIRTEKLIAVQNQADSKQEHKNNADNQRAFLIPSH
jgi:hypothetical protein